MKLLVLFILIMCCSCTQKTDVKDTSVSTRRVEQDPMLEPKQGRVEEPEEPEDPKPQVQIEEKNVPLILMDENSTRYVGDEMSLLFEDDGVYINTSDGSGTFRECTIDSEDGSIFVILELEDENGTSFFDLTPLKELEVVDICTLKDINGNIYQLPDTEGKEITTKVFYKFFSDYNDPTESEAGIVFFDSGITKECDYYGEYSDGTYEINGDKLSIEIEGNIVEATIINRRLIEFDNGVILLNMEV